VRGSLQHSLAALKVAAHSTAACSAPQATQPVLDNQGESPYNAASISGTMSMPSLLQGCYTVPPSLQPVGAVSTALSDTVVLLRRACSAASCCMSESGNSSKRSKWEWA
jgi:hypothetical protein